MGDNHDNFPEAAPLASASETGDAGNPIDDPDAVESIREFASGDVVSETKFRNGDSRTVFRNGDVITEFAGGNQRIQYRDGRIVMQFKTGDRESETILPNGVVRTRFRRGEIVSEDQHPDGSAEIMMRDGTCVTIKTNGVTMISRPSGSYETRDIDGKLIDS